jgi:ATP-dependent RNA helicase DeaD
MGFAEPMPVQAATFPLITAGRDLMVQSRTGSGKTAAFGIPFANGIVNGRRQVRAGGSCCCRRASWRCRSPPSSRRSASTGRSPSSPFTAGAPMGRQVEQLRDGGQIVCGTPGRVLDHLRRGTLRWIACAAPCWTSATRCCRWASRRTSRRSSRRRRRRGRRCCSRRRCPEGIQRLARRFLKQPEFLKLSGDYVSVHDIRHVYYSIPGIQREEELLRILDFEEPKSAIIFCNTREETGRVAAFLRGKGHDAEAISSDLSQSDRERVLGRMRQGGIKFLVATDVAGARHRHREPVARVQLHVPGGTRDLHPPHRPHRPRRTEGNGDLADRTDRGRVVSTT